MVPDNTYKGNTIINARLIENQANAIYPSIYIEAGNSVQGLVTVNASENIDRLSSDNTTSIKSCVIGMVLGKLVINGDVKASGSSRCFNYNGAAGKTINHTGEANNNGIYPLSDFEVAANSIVANYKGTYTSTNPNVINITGAGSTLEIEGEINADSQDAGTTAGINITTAMGEVRLGDIVIKNTNGVGTKNSINADAAQNVKCLHTAGSNAILNVNVTALIQAFTVDVNYL